VQLATVKKNKHGAPFLEFSCKRTKEFYTIVCVAAFLHGLSRVLTCEACVHIIMKIVFGMKDKL